MTILDSSFLMIIANDNTMGNCLRWNLNSSIVSPINLPEVIIASITWSLRHDIISQVLLHKLIDMSMLDWVGRLQWHWWTQGCSMGLINLTTCQDQPNLLVLVDLGWADKLICVLVWVGLQFSRFWAPSTQLNLLAHKNKN